MPEDGSSSVLYSMAVSRHDYGLSCIVLGTMFLADVFQIHDTVLFTCNLAFLALALPKWYREVGRFITSSQPRRLYKRHSEPSPQRRWVIRW